MCLNFISYIFRKNILSKGGPFFVFIFLRHFRLTQINNRTPLRSAADINVDDFMDQFILSLVVSLLLFLFLLVFTVLQYKEYAAQSCTEQFKNEIWCKLLLTKWGLLCIWVRLICRLSVLLYYIMVYYEFVLQSWFPGYPIDGHNVLSQSSVRPKLFPYQ